METSSDEDAVSSPKKSKGEATARKPKSHHPTKFNIALQREYPWLQKDPKDDFRAQCKVCPTSSSTGKLASFRCEKSDINRHASTEKHVKNARACTFGNSKKMFSFVQPDDPNRALEDKVKYAEMKLAGYVAAHDSSFLSMDHLADVLRDIFPDSEIAQNMALKRTKTKGVILNVIGQDEKDDLVRRLNAVKFSVLSDESTDISCVKTSCTLVRFYDINRGKIVSRFWDLHQVFTDDDPDGAAEGATARKLYGLMEDSFTSHKVPLSNVIGFGSDGCNVMMGRNDSVFSRWKKSCPGIYIAKCICHSLHLCASAACTCLPRSCEDLARNIFNFFHCSAKRRAQYAEFQHFFSLDLLQMLHPSQTRWLSLLAVVERILNQWNALRLFFDAKWLEEKLESAERIHVLLNDPITKAYYLFLQWILPKVVHLNALFQSEKSVIAIVHTKMVTTYESILSSFMRRDYICRTALPDIDPNDSSKWLPSSQLYMGTGVLNQLNLKAIVDQPQLAEDFKVRCRRFLVTLSVELKKRYNFADPLLSVLPCLTPNAALSQKERERTPSLFHIVKQVPRIVDPSDQEKVQRLDDQWRELPFHVSSLPEEFSTDKSMDIEEFWHKLNIHANEIGERPFATLAHFVMEVLSLPIANCDCERKFSKINQIKTKKRNRLLTKTVGGVLLADECVRSSGGCCVDFKPRKSMYSRMTAATIYNSHGNASAEEDEDFDNPFSSAAA